MHTLYISRLLLLIAFYILCDGAIAAPFISNFNSLLTSPLIGPPPYAAIAPSGYTEDGIQFDLQILDPLPYDDSGVLPRRNQLWFPGPIMTNAYSGSAALALWSPGVRLRISLSDQTAFSPFSITIYPWAANTPSTVQITGDLSGGGSITTSATTSGDVHVGTVLSFSTNNAFLGNSITALRIDSNSQGFQLDDLVIYAVPEPAPITTICIVLFLFFVCGVIKQKMVQRARASSSGDVEPA